MSESHQSSLNNRSQLLTRVQFAVIGLRTGKNYSENITNSAIFQVILIYKKQLDCFLQTFLLSPVLYLLASWHFGLCSSPWKQF